MTCPDADWTLKLNTGEKSAELGVGYVQFAMQGLRHQMSQGAANWTIDPGDRFTFYRLIDSVLPSTLGKDGHEKSFFDGIDTSWPGLAGQLGAEERKLPGLRSEFTEIAKLVADATAKIKGDDASTAAAPLMKIVTALNHVSSQVRGSSLSAAAKVDVLTRIADKQQHAETALNLALGVTLTAHVTPSLRPNQRSERKRRADHRLSRPGISGSRYFSQRIQASLGHRPHQVGSSCRMEHD